MCIVCFSHFPRIYADGVYNATAAPAAKPRELPLPKGYATRRNENA